MLCDTPQRTPARVKRTASSEVENMNSINILGTEYSFRVDEQVMNDAGADGMCRFHSKEIILRPEENILEDGTDEENRTYYSKVIRHEVVHAALHESGLTHYANDELLVEWLAVQFPKLAEIFKKAGCST